MKAARNATSVVIRAQWQPPGDLPEPPGDLPEPVEPQEAPERPPEEAPSEPTEIPEAPPEFERRRHSFLLRQTVPRRRVAGLLLVLTSVTFSAAGHGQSAPPNVVRERVEQLLFTGWPQINGAPIANPKPLAEFYSRRDFEPAWTPTNTSQWLDWLGRIDSEGLRPQDYYFEQLRQLRESGDTDPQTTASLDVLLTASWLRAAHDLRFGKVDPTSLETTWNLDREPPSDWDPLGTLDAALKARSLDRFFEELLPKPQLYDELKNALRQYREIAARGGWPLVPAGPTLRLSDRGERVAILRQRLAVTGDDPNSAPAEPADTYYGPQLETGVRHFQQRHGLDADGVVGAATLAALNVPVATRIDQIRLNLERGRWVFGDLSDRFLVVNIASFQIFLV
ncbi:MAG TPA: peptidoglycan-binding protein, partial [Gammaproteobacteria bacterium]|nr:peptidoglycan-binding protein [Gammaproteobacteria bacterium]